MKITNYKDQYIKVQSKYLDELIATPSGYSSIYVEGKSGCSETLVSDLIAVSPAITNTWVADLDTPTKLENSIYQLFIKNLTSEKEFNCITMPIDLGYVADTCTDANNNCSLQLYDAVMGIQFKDQIDAWFTDKGIVSDVTITFDVNKIIITNVPQGFGFSKIGYNLTDVQPYSEVYFGFVNEADFILVEDGILIKPSFFNDTTLQDGVYKIKVRLTKVSDSGYNEETMCAFIDIALKCQVAQYIKTLSEGTFSDDANSAMLLHYGLVNGSNCGCNCEELCSVYNALLDLIGGSSITNSSNNDCGC